MQYFYLLAYSVVMITIILLELVDRMLYIFKIRIFLVKTNKNINIIGLGNIEVLSVISGAV